METLYDPIEIEKKWQRKWEESRILKAKEDCSAKKYYLLDMFPYPSGKIHMGHVRAYSIGDVIARYKKMKGYNVLHPMGWDAFGMPAENAAIESGVHPAEWTYKNIDRMKSQLKSLGFSYDWSREFATCSPEYYKWEQWLFIKMLENNMVYRKKSFVNWCSRCQTVLANEQVSESRTCWRCDETIVQKKLWQWFLKITEYANDLLIHCDKLSGWPDKVVAMQKNWIGRRDGVEVDFPVEELDCKLSVFTTRPDTIFGVTFIGIAPEHPTTLELLKGNSRYKKLAAFVERLVLMKRNSKTADFSQKEGMFTGKYCVNPVNGEKIPIYISNYVLMEYGSGVVMGVPAHDQRDFDFAKKYDLPVKIVIKPTKILNNIPGIGIEKAFTDEGIMVNSGQFDGVYSQDALDDIIEYLENKNIGRKIVNFRLKDWGISRQRYWGTPIPVVYCDTCGLVPVKESDLPVILPEELNLLDNGVSPLHTAKDFLVTICPGCGRTGARRETDTMDTFVESSWYFGRFCNPDYKNAILDPKAVKYWMPVDQYIGGIEHAILHLLYSRYFTRVLNKLGLVDFKEPFLNLLTQGMVCKETFTCSRDGFIFPEDTLPGKNGIICRKCEGPVDVGKVQKMSKSKKNVVAPDVLVKKYGADTVRLFCLFAAPPEKNLEWSEGGIAGCFRFLNRTWCIVLNWAELIYDTSDFEEMSFETKILSNSFKELFRQTHQTIAKVTRDIEVKFHFNTAISAIMELVNFMCSIEYFKISEPEKSVMRFSLKSVVLMLSPMVPHFSEELWKRIGEDSFIIQQKWPIHDKQVILEGKITFIVQINGKVRSRIEVERNMHERDLKKLIFSNERVASLIKEKEVINVFFVKNRLVNIVTRKR